SAIGYLSGKKRVYVAGQFDFSVKDHVEITPIMIGEFLSEHAVDPVLRYRWPHAARVYPETIDCFALIRQKRTPSLEQLRALELMPEKKVKEAFAAIIGEPFVPVDWPGEKSDLYTGQL